MLPIPSKLSVQSFLITITQPLKVSNGARRPGMGLPPRYITMPIGTPKVPCTDVSRSKG